jgi:hypothetical protein
MEIPHGSAGRGIPLYGYREKLLSIGRAPITYPRPNMLHHRLCLSSLFKSYLRVIENFVGLGILSSWVFAAPLPTEGKPGFYPDWWFERDVIIRKPSSATAEWPKDYSQPDDYAAANLGQLKFITIKAKAELEALLGEAGPGARISSLVEVWSRSAPLNVVRDDYGVLNQGQLKFIAGLFYERLHDFGYVGAPLEAGQVFPWDGASQVPDSYAAANLGQLKFLFSFNPKIWVADSDQDGMEDHWESSHGLDPANSADASIDMEGDGVSNLQEFKFRADPFSRDGDVDGMSDDYETAFGLNPAFNDGASDSDGDGAVNDRDARPNDDAIGQLSVTISAPAPGSAL